MFDAQLWLERWMKQNNISQDKITDDEFEEVEEALDEEMNEYLSAYEKEFMHNFMRNQCVDWKKR